MPIRSRPFFVQYVDAIYSMCNRRVTVRYLLTSLMHSLHNPSRAGCIQLCRELGRQCCYASFLLNSEKNEIGCFTPQLILSIVKCTVNAFW